MADYLRPFRELFRDDPRLRFRVVKEVLTTPRLSEERIKYIDEQLLLPCVGSFWARARAWDLVVCADHCFGGARRRSPSIYIGHGRQCKTYPHDDFEYTYGRGSVERGRPAYRKIFSASEADRETIVKAKPLFSDVVVVVGNLENDRLMAQSARRDEFRRQFGYKPDDVVVFVVSTFGKYCLWHTMGDSLLEAARGLLGQFTFVLSAHPHEYRRKPPGERVWGEHLRSQRQHGFAVREPSESWIPYMVAADIVLSDYTGLLEGAILLQKPIVLTPVPEQLIWKHSANAKLRDFVPILNDARMLRHCLIDARNSERLDKIRKLAQAINPHPGEAAMRIRKEIYALLKLSSPPSDLAPYVSVLETVNHDFSRHPALQ